MNKKSGALLLNKTIIILGFAFLAVFSIIFARERILNSDAAFYLFKLINFENFNIEHHRYSAFISQLIVLPFIKTGVHISNLIIIYSLSFVILFFIVYKIIDRFLHNKAAALTVLLVLSAGISDIAYRPVSESTQGLIYSLFLFGLLYYQNTKKPIKKWKLVLYYLIAFATLLLCYFAHPITIIPLFFITGFYIIDKKAWKEPLPYTVLLMTVIIFSYKYFFNNLSSYEEDKMSPLSQLAEHTGQFFKLYPMRFIGKRIFTVYLVPAILWLALNIKYIISKEFLKILFVNLSIVGFLFLFNLMFSEGASDIEMQKNIMTVNLLIFLAFSNDIYYKLPKIAGILPIALAAILTFSAVIVHKPKNTYTARVKYLHNLTYNLENLEGTKFYTYESGLDIQKIMFPWSVPVETILISSLHGPEHSKTLFPLSSSDKIPEYIDDPQLFMLAPFWRRFNINLLNSRYFRLNNEPYKYIDPEVLKEHGGSIR